MIEIALIDATNTPRPDLGHRKLRDCLRQRRATGAQELFRRSEDAFN